MSDSNADVFASLSEGDLIQFEGPAATKNPHEVAGDDPSEIDGGGAIMMVKGPGGASKMLTQNKHNPDNIYIMSMGNMNDSGSLMKNLRKVGEA